MPDDLQTWSYAYFAKKGVYHLHKILSSWIIQCAVSLSPLTGETFHLLDTKRRRAAAPRSPRDAPYYRVFGAAEDVVKRFDAFLAL